MSARDDVALCRGQRWNKERISETEGSDTVQWWKQWKMEDNMGYGGS